MTWADPASLPLPEVLAWAEVQPWARAMADCRQDATWHAEGDVWTHTRMVCGQLPLLDDRDALTAQERTVHRFTALLHDSAKPLTSQVDPVHWSSHLAEARRPGRAPPPHRPPRPRL